MSKTTDTPSQVNEVLEALEGKRATFVGVEYTNSAGEKSRQKINVGVNYSKALEKSLRLLEGKVYNDPVYQQAQQELLTSLQKRVDKQKEKDQLKHDIEHLESIGDTGQLQEKRKLLNELIKQEEEEAYYEKVERGVKRHKETGVYYIDGFVVSKTVLEEGEYKEVNSRPKTIAKRKIEKELPIGYYKQFKIGNAAVIKANGMTIVKQQ